MPPSVASKSEEADYLEETQPSHVIHFKNVPKFTSKHDLLKITSQFGPHELLVILRPKEQALVEMKNLDDAIALYNYAMESPLIVHNCTLKVSYSIHQHLQSNPHDYKPSNIILITFCGSAKAPITLFDLANMCNRIHEVVKILMFHHDAGPQALVQFHSAEEAKEVKESLEKEELQVDDNLITFEIQYSKLTDLRVNQNNKFTWDFTVSPSHEFPLTDCSSPSFAPEMEPKSKACLSYHTSSRIANSYRNQNNRPKRVDYPVDYNNNSDSLQQLLSNGSLKSYRMQQPSMEPMISPNRWSSNNLQEYATNNNLLQHNQFGATLSDTTFDTMNRSRAFSFNGRNSGSVQRLSSPDLRPSDPQRNSDPVSTNLASILGDYRPYRAMMTDYEIPFIPTNYHYSSSPRPADIIYDVHSCTVTFFTLYHTTKHESFISALKEFAAVADFVVHHGTDSIIVAVAYFSHYGCKELAVRVCEKEHISNDCIEVVNTVDYDSFHRIKDYVIPDLLRVPISNSFVNMLIEGQITVFPVAICYSNFPSTFEMKDVFDFAKKYGTVQRISDMNVPGDSPTFSSQGEEISEDVSFRVQYNERYNILLILQNRSKLSINGRPIKAEPLF